MADLDRARALLAEKRKRGVFPSAVAKVRAQLFPQQEALIASPHRRKVSKAGRRGGKTHGLVALALDVAAQYPSEVIPVCERTISCAAAQKFWSELIAFNDVHKLDIDLHHTFKIATLPNRSRVMIAGCETLEQADKLRGGRYPAALVDEAQSYRGHVLEYLIDDVLSPALLDLNGSLIVAGTPRHVRQGPWFEMCHSAQWEQHFWSMLDNPFIPGGKLGASMTPEQARKYREDALEAERARRQNSAAFRREWLGEWVEGDSSLMYDSFREAVNVIPCMPAPLSEHPWRYCLSVDFGVVDPTAFVVLAWRRGDPNLYIVESVQAEGLSPSVVASRMEGYRQRLHVNPIVGDTNGQGKAFAQEYLHSFGVVVKPARKVAKALHVSFVNGDFASGRIKIVRSSNQDLTADLGMLPWNEERDNAAEGFPDHLCDALLYGAREVAQLRTDYGEAIHREGSPEYLEALEKKWLEDSLKLQRQLYGEESMNDDWKDKYRAD